MWTGIFLNNVSKPNTLFGSTIGESFAWSFQVKMALSYFTKLYMELHVANIFSLKLSWEHKKHSEVIKISWRFKDLFTKIAGAINPKPKDSSFKVLNPNDRKRIPFSLFLLTSPRFETSKLGGGGSNHEIIDQNLHIDMLWLFYVRNVKTDACAKQLSPSIVCTTHLAKTWLIIN